MKKTTAEISHETWRMLNRRKSPGESMDDVIQGLIHQAEESEEPEQSPVEAAAHDGGGA